MTKSLVNYILMDLSGWKMSSSGKTSMVATGTSLTVGFRFSLSVPVEADKAVSVKKYDLL